MRTMHVSQTGKWKLTTIVILVLCICPLVMPGRVMAANAGQFTDTSDDMFIYAPHAFNGALTCTKINRYSSNDVTEVSWAYNGSIYAFNISFQEAVNLANVSVMLFFFVNGTRSGPDQVEPFFDKNKPNPYSFFVHLNTTSTRFCINYTNQRLITPVIHDGGKTVELDLITVDTPKIQSMPNLLAIDEWFCVGYSLINVIEGEGYDYINWDRRFQNDQLFLPVDYSWIYWVVFLGVGAIVGVLVLVIVWRKKQRASSQSKPQ
jgi:hypothetical protein